MDKFTYVGNGDVNAIDDLYKNYKNDPDSVDEGWKKFFEGFDFARTDFNTDGGIPENFQKELQVLNLINEYRFRGHLFTKTNPVRERRKYSPTLDLETFGLSEEDLETEFQAGTEMGIGKAKLKEIVKILKQTYCESIGIEYNYIREPERLLWLRENIDIRNRPQYNAEQKLRIFEMLNRATHFEQYLQKKYVGQKRFSIEGGEALIPALDKAIQHGAELGVEEFVVGMAHRGRLNTLVNIFDKEHDAIFNEFDGKQFDNDDTFDGDVKYHLGYSTDKKTESGKNVHLTLAPNPSHLEAVNPVVEGIARSKIDQYLKDENKIIPILIHGDAAVAAQGVVYEVVQMAQLDGYRVGGTIHIVVNNQVGFTTNYLDGRSSTYCTDVGKTTLCPVFHVNGDDVEAMVKTMEIAINYRQKFNRDVFIDLLCYRKYGHNEGDEPKFTQPKLYDIISKHPNPREIYLEKLIDEGVIDKDKAKSMAEGFVEALDKSYDSAKKQEKTVVLNFLAETWKGYERGTAEDFEKSIDTKVDKKKLVELGKKMSSLPDGKKYFRKIKKLFDQRTKMIEEDNLDWGMGELLAYATLLDEGHPVRISGQDVERGTFSHRHAVIKTEDNEEEIIPLNLLNKKQAELSIYNSLLSEYGVLGFDYGYSLSAPNGLTIWEAQFGDFNNGAQIMIDQFITAGEDKWNVHSGLVMLLPHGYEGMGAEHSSGRMERFLQLCADLNIQVANATTPANFFHLLRRQVKRNFRKPLVVFSPKMLLRYPKAVSKLEDMATGGFQEVIDDPNVTKKDVDSVVLCSGKFYYDLIEQAEEKGVDNMAFVRLEQLYPFPKNQILKLVKTYKNADQIIWAQEEPENMGALTHVFMNLKNDLDIDLIARPASAAPAAGSTETHQRRLSELFKQVFKYAKVKAK